jgi:hypothetical protein
MALIVVLAEAAADLRGGSLYGKCEMMMKQKSPSSSDNSVDYRPPSDAAKSTAESLIIADKGARMFTPRIFERAEVSSLSYFEFASKAHWVITRQTTHTRYAAGVFSSNS